MTVKTVLGEPLSSDLAKLFGNELAAMEVERKQAEYFCERIKEHAEAARSGLDSVLSTLKSMKAETEQKNLF